jgi:hypothetical protein
MMDYPGWQNVYPGYADLNIAVLVHESALIFSSVIK